MPKTRSLLSLPIVAGACAAIASAEEIRWIAPDGGNWNDPANWDLARTPGEGDVVIFDLDAEYSVSMCETGGELWSELIIDNSNITFELCGQYLASLSVGSANIWIPTVRVGSRATSPTRAVFENGQIFSSDIFDASILIGKEGGEEAVWVIPLGEEISVAGAGVTLRGLSRLVVDGELRFGYGGSILVGSDSSLEVAGTLAAIGFASIILNGVLDVEGDLDGNNKAAIMGPGYVMARDGSTIHDWVLRDGINMEIQGESSVSSDFIDGVYFNMSAATGGAELFVTGYCCQALLRNSIVVLSAEIQDSAPRVRLQGDSIAGGGFANSMIVVPESIERSISVGELRTVGAWSFELPFGISLDVEMPGGRGYILRWQEVSETAYDTVALGVPDPWCPADLNFDGRADFFDIARFLEAYSDRSAWANYNNDLDLNFFDVAEYIGQFNAGCP